MITLLTSLGLSSRIAKVVAYIGVPLLILAALWLALHLWGNSRYKAGREYEAALYKAASDKLIQDAATSADKAERQSVARQMDFTARTEAEKVKIDEAISQGKSPLDVLFPVAADNGVR